MDGETVKLLIFGPLAALVAILDIRANRRNQATVDAALAAMEPNAVHLTGGAIVRGSSAPTPFARLSFDRATIVFSPRWRFVPVRSMVIRREDVSRLQCRDTFLWRLCVRTMNEAGVSKARFFTGRGSRVLADLVARDWPVVRATGRAWKEQPTWKVG